MENNYKFKVGVYFFGAPYQGFEVFPPSTRLLVFDQYREDKLVFIPINDNEMLVVYFKSNLYTHKGGRAGSNFGIAVELKGAAMGSKDFQNLMINNAPTKNQDAAATSQQPERVLQAIIDILVDVYSDIKSERALLAEYDDITAFQINSFASVQDIIEPIKERVERETRKILEACASTLQEIARKNKLKSPPLEMVQPAQQTVSLPTENIDFQPPISPTERGENPYYENIAPTFAPPARENLWVRSLLMLFCFLVGFLISAVYHRIYATAASATPATSASSKIENANNSLEIIAQHLNKSKDKLEIEDWSTEHTVDAIKTNIDLLLSAKLKTGTASAPAKTKSAPASAPAKTKSAPASASALNDTLKLAPASASALNDTLKPKSDTNTTH